MHETGKGKADNAPAHDDVKCVPLPNIAESIDVKKCTDAGLLSGRGNCE
ncbi:hypothetical protein Q7O_003376 [Pectobacterium carotovorum subsp. carotovorum PCCS1]|nr:hypothetical protein [Pectobacterium carotovorum subsp. carotovorum PCCS1]